MSNRRMFVAVLTTALAITVPQFVRAQAGAHSKAEQEVIQAEKDRFAAIVKADEAALNKLLADDLTYTHSNANMQTKAQFIADVKSGAIDYVLMQPNESDWKVRVIGNVAIVNGTANVNVIDHGNNLTFKIRYTNNHVNRGGTWQMVNWQSTRFPQP